ncbi:ketose-bisphosphate aldolase class-II [Thermodesulfobium narugense DSM 14796]|uniref:Ketose-bisphosphate aldolase class-II n=1 Tax=Thermodesulfobium narugense DSM 14796 TaxID=747365 RepID=M1E6H6_9BACT|nr:class II fructose-bisphosphate aldolase [Thermodesulfobium narugense]AEE14801.1 ketose-bisphosphate aldolase class-II [Thermodesulfobium narugense DSM 14796]
MFGTKEEITKNLEANGLLINGKLTLNKDRLRENVIDDLIKTAVFTQDSQIKNYCYFLIREFANMMDIVSSSIHDLYMAKGRGEGLEFTVPAINIRCLTYDFARRIFKVAIERNTTAIIFEIAKSEIEYTFQRPLEYISCVLAAAIKEGYRGPVFVQGDHFQFSSKNYFSNPELELDNIKKLTKEAIEAGFYNIDIDPSTLVDYTKPTLVEQQYHNYINTAKMTDFIRSIQPEGINVSVGAEIGHIGGKNSTVEEFEAFMNAYLDNLKSSPGISKISVQTGTAHGGIPLPDGTVASVKLDFNVLDSIGKCAREKYHIAGAVQHGASTLPDELFNNFPKHKTAEIHLATGFQNIMFDFAPEEFREENFKFIEENFKSEWKENMTREQFIYKTRKKVFGPLKEKWWNLSDADKNKILDVLEKKIEFLFSQLNVFDTKSYTDKYIKLVKIGYKENNDLSHKNVDFRALKFEEGAD